MRASFIVATLATSTAAVCISLIAPSGVAQAESAQDTIAQLNSEGYEVNIDRVGSARLEDCVVTNVRNPQTETRYVRDYYGSRDEDGNRKSRRVPVVVRKSISVSLNCSG